MSTQPRPRLTPAEYLARERAAERKSEFFAGEAYAMSGASRPHNLIVGNAVSALVPQLRGKGCEVYPSDMRVKVQASGLYTYPDLTVVCGKPDFEDQHVDTLLNPTVLIEVLSDSTEAYDRGKKTEHYRRLPSLREYLLVAQDRRHVELFTRSEAGFWTLKEFGDADTAVQLASIGCELQLAELYARVEVTPAG